MLKTISLAALLLMAFSVAGLVIRESLFSLQPVAIIMQIVAAALMIWARISFGRRSFHAAANPTSGGLVTTGPYRYIRHPIYSAICIFIWPGILSHLSLVNILLGVILFAGVIIRILCEEQMIAKVYPEYREYALTTKRVLPYIL